MLTSEYVSISNEQFIQSAFLLRTEVRHHIKPEAAGGDATPRQCFTIPLVLPRGKNNLWRQKEVKYFYTIIKHRSMQSISMIQRSELSKLIHFHLFPR